LEKLIQEKVDTIFSGAEVSAEGRRIALGSGGTDGVLPRRVFSPAYRDIAPQRFY
jgi:hypothetical protein